MNQRDGTNGADSRRIFAAELNQVVATRLFKAGIIVCPHYPRVSAERLHAGTNPELP
jgi:hypothetical protein